MKTVTATELKSHATKTDCWFAIHGKVYDVTKFLDEHPGSVGKSTLKIAHVIYSLLIATCGEEVMLEHAGADATEAFEDVGHSEDARELLKDYLVGDLDGAAKLDTKSASEGAAQAAHATGKKKNEGSPGDVVGALTRLVVPLTLLLGAVYFLYLKSDIVSKK